MTRRESRRALRVDGASLTLTDFERVACGRPPAKVVLSADALRAVARSAKVLDKALGAGQTVYGVNTGFGRFAEVRISAKQARQLQRNLLLSHAAGVGPPFSCEEVRGMMLLRLNLLAKGHSGIRHDILQRLIDFLNADVTPVVPRRGSVGACGDLAPMAHIGLALIGEGEVELSGRRTKTRRALAHLGLKPLTLERREGLALINGVQASTALLAIALGRVGRLLDAADFITGLSALAVGARPDPYDQRIAALRGRPGQAESARRTLEILRAAGAGRKLSGRVQDPYCLRCAPQVHGTCRDVMREVQNVCATELNAATDNPLIFPDTGEILSAGNFHGAPIGHAADQLAIAVADVASISERRTALLQDPAINRATAFLVPPEGQGLNSGLMMWQVTAAALVSEMKTLAHPASVDSIPTSLGQEDHVSMSMWAADKLCQIVERWRTILAIELLSAWRALALGRNIPRHGRLNSILSRLRGIHPPPFTDEMLGGVVAELEELLENLGGLLPKPPSQSRSRRR